MAKKNLKEIIVGVEDEEHPDVFVALGRGNRWKIITMPDSGMMLEGFLKGIMLSTGIPADNIKNYLPEEGKPAYFKEHFLRPIYPEGFKRMIEYLQNHQ